MSLYNTFTVQDFANPLFTEPSQQGSHKVQHVANGTAKSPGFGYPDLYIEIAFKSDSKTKCINPANAYTRDVILLVAPYGTGLSKAFHTPTQSFYKEIHGSRLTYRFLYTVRVAGSAKVHLGYKDLVSIEKDIHSMTGVVIVNGWLDTVSGEGHADAHKVPAADGKMRVE